MKVHRYIRCFMTCAAILAVEASSADEGLYLQKIKPLLQKRCLTCHGALRQEAGLRLDTAVAARTGSENGAVLNPETPATSLLLRRVTSRDPDDRMPPEGDPLGDRQIELLRTWIAAGASGPTDEIGQADPAQHWAFLPLPRINAASEVGIDDFIDARLSTSGIRRNGPASAVTLIRRMFLDLHGLPPSLEQIENWSTRLSRGVSSTRRLNPVVVRELVDELLSSPRYGERWARHWLDVVRYADTHGYEVNTPRPNAWPYRDYVIRAFNRDKPYDKFITDQLAGDFTGEDAATGFLVAAAALLPGQIGKDDASKRLARQDALDEMIVGTSATFLGLTLGCARCHDHKFDPLTQRDYYAMQAFFAGVEYGEREIQGPSREQRLAEAKQLVPQIQALAGQLRWFQPLASTERTIVIDDEDTDRVTSLMKKNGNGINPAGPGRGYANDPGAINRMANLSRGRYTWWPSVPGKDVFTWNFNSAGQFRIWVSWGVHGSGVHTRDARYLLDLDGDLSTKNDQKEIAAVDQYYFAGVSTGESEKKPLWSGLYDTGVHELTGSSRLILRGGETGTGITADVVVLQETSRKQTQPLPHLRGPVSALQNLEMFVPVAARFLRFTTFETSSSNRYEPCIDELEVFTAADQPVNVALADRGTQATSSGNYSSSGKHQLSHINDGRYGNSYSWISSQKGSGWVQLEFSRTEKINRIEWARDREGRFSDRLPVRYRIDVSLDGQDWSPVAQSDDRVLPGTPYDNLIAVQRGVSGTAADQIPQQAVRLKELRARKAELEQPMQVYAGRFRAPEITRVLHRGDPEQPGAPLPPHVPVALGAVGADQTHTTQQRRMALARWIAHEQNPLTARVVVNRIWQFHFGSGLVETPSDFGLRASPPSHPQLLDWLAQDFLSSGWSIKHLHRRILMSGTYQQSAAIQPHAQESDGDCRLLWRFPSRRLEAEAIRDSILAVNGRLNLKMGGPGFNFFKTRGGLSGFPPVEKFGPEEMRRMIYAHHIRMEPVPVFGAFDCPDAGQPTPVRSRSTTAIQALNLFNSPFVLEQAEALADRVRREVGSDIGDQVTGVWQLALGRIPYALESSAARAAATEFGLETVCRALFNSNEFLFLP